MTPVGASAPGKALLCGEYAVLEGAPAVVAAVGRRVSVAWREDQTTVPPEVEATLQLAQAEVGQVPWSLTLDVSDLEQDRIKLGLGSSAAAATATAGAVFATHGRDLGDSTARLHLCAPRARVDCAAGQWRRRRSFDLRRVSSIRSRRRQRRNTHSATSERATDSLGVDGTSGPNQPARGQGASASQ
ncbi:MAG: hypothetical protein EP303_05910 [Deltaproteobacteria bacterium]|nr:MAG: hypothetical protein EP303_05910 [Deltaproteobacteria bacterium]